MSRSSHRRWFMKKALLKNFAMLKEKHVLESLFHKVVPIEVYSCEHCEIF